MARRRWSDLHWDGHLAHQAVYRAVKGGKLTPHACEVCGVPVTVAHHDDYEKRLEVRWLCDSHHRLWHLENPVDYEVPAPPRKPRPVVERKPNRGKQFHRYLRPRARFMRSRGVTYQEIARELGVSISTAHAWAKETG